MNTPQTPGQHSKGQHGSVPDKALELKTEVDNMPPSLIQKQLAKFETTLLHKNNKKLTQEWAFYHKT